MRKLFILFLASSMFTMSYSQSQREHPKGSYVDSLQHYYQNVDLPVYVFVSTSPSGTPTRLKEASQDTLRPIYLDGHGVHNLRHINSENQRVENFPIFADGKAPRTNISLKGAPSYVYDSKQFFGKGLTLSLQALDEMSGVKMTLISLNGNEYGEYAHDLIVDREGVYTYKYYSVDNVGNVEVPKDKFFILDVTPPKTYYDIIGINSDRVISLTTKITLSAVDSSAGVAAVFYSIDGDPFKQYVGGAIPIATLTNGEHTFSFYSIDNVKNQEKTQSIVFYLDRLAPIMSADILGDKFIVEDKVYFSGRTKVKLTAIDNRAGVKDVLYSINDGKFVLYKEPFYLPMKAGKYEIKYYATDNIGNNTGENKTTHSSGVVYVDLTGPQIKQTFVGSTFTKGEVTYINSKTLNKITARDSESGVQRLAYIVNAGEELPYGEPFVLKQDGLHKIVSVAYDNVNNRNEEFYTVFVDNTGPDITYSFSTKGAPGEDNIEVYPSYVTLFLSAIDDGTTVSSLSYTINDGKELPYTTPVTGFGKFGTYKVRVRALDALGNESIKSFTFKTNDL